MNAVEDLMYQLSGFFLAPVLCLIAGLFIYSCFALGDFATHWWQRRRNREAYRESVQQSGATASHRALRADIAGYELTRYAASLDDLDENQLSVFARKRLEALRVTTRVAPMLGLVATMIPMGPALQALANGNIQGISENLIVAFSAVIFGLLISSTTFWLAAVKKRWLADEMVDLLRIHDKEPVRELS